MTHAHPFEHVYAAAREACRAARPDLAAGALLSLSASLAEHPSARGQGAALAAAWAASLAAPAPEAP